MNKHKEKRFYYYFKIYKINNIHNDQFIKLLLCSVNKKFQKPK